MNKDNFQKFLIKQYKKWNQYINMIFDMNYQNEKFIDIVIWKNKKTLFKKSEYIIDKQAKYNKENDWFIYSSYCLSYLYL